MYMYDQGYALKKILASSSGTQPCRLVCPEVKLSHPYEKKNQKLINYCETVFISKFN